MAEKLAALGGTPVLDKADIRPWPWVTDDDRAAVAAVLADGNLNKQRQEQSEGLAREFASYVGMKHCIPTNSGTAALHMCIAGLEIGPGHEVITTAHTY